jgi:cardiolipin synthase
MPRTDTCGDARVTRVGGLPHAAQSRNYVARRHKLPVPSARIGARRGIVAAAGCLLVACMSLRHDPPAPTPVQVVGAEGTLPPDRASAVVARAVAEAPDPEAIRRLESLMESVSTGPLFKDNEVRLLVDGPDTYEAMLAAIGQARTSINLETYIFNEDEVGERFADALSARSAAGIETRVIYDSLGSRASSPAFFERMRAAGVELVEFHPVNPLEGGNPVNLNVRDHRKLLIVDGRIAFTGGINLDRNYSSSSVSKRRAPKHAQPGWRDTHIEVRGPAVAGFQRLFFANWREAGGATEGDMSRYFPEPLLEGRDLVRVLSAIGGDGKPSPIRIAYGEAMDAAARRIWITQSYFGPDADLLRTMTAAAGRGVDVRIIVSGVSDAPMMLAVSRSCYEELLEGGVRIFESDDFMLHAKTAVIDGVWSTVGSSNLDYRSFIHNYEVNAVVVSESFGGEMETLFRSDLGRSREIRLEEWRERSWVDRMKETLSRFALYWL